MKFVRVLGLAVVCFGLSTNMAGAQTGPAPQPALLITATPVSSSVVVGAPAPIRISLTNVSTTTITLQIFSPHPTYHLFGFSLTANGQHAQKTALHRSVKNRQRVDDPPANLSLRSILVDIPPNGTKVYKANLEDLFNISDPAQYHLVVSMIDPVSGVRIVAPEVLISVTK
jgi:hypothetical protein